MLPGSIGLLFYLLISGNHDIKLGNGPVSDTVKNIEVDSSTS